MKVRLYMALLMPMSRTRPARSPKAFDSRWPWPNSFTSSAPDTLKRSVIWVFMAELRSKPSRVIGERRRPTRLAGITKIGQQDQRQDRDPPLEQRSCR